MGISFFISQLLQGQPLCSNNHLEFYYKINMSSLRAALLMCFTNCPSSHKGHYYLIHLVISHTCCDKLCDEVILRVCFGSQFEGIVHRDRGAMTAGAGNSWLGHIHDQETEVNTKTSSIFIQLGTPVHRVVPPTVRVILSMPINLI